MVNVNELDGDMLIDQARELVQGDTVGGLAVGQSGQFTRLGFAQIKARCQRLFQGVAFVGMLIIVSPQHLEQQRRGGQLQTVPVRTRLEIGFYPGTEEFLNGA